MFQKLSLSFIIFFLAFSMTSPALAESEEGAVEIFVFAREDCRHCQDEKKFLTELESEYDFLKARYLNIHAESYAAQWRELSKLEGYPLATPLTVVGGAVISGFDTAKTTGKTIENIALESRGEPTLAPQDLINRGGAVRDAVGASAPICTADGSGICTIAPEPEFRVSLPFIGSLDVGAYPLAAISLVLGFVDGFNPCAMWVLVTFLLILAQSRSKQEMIAFAGMFLAAQAILYWLILNIWFTAWNFVALDAIVTPIIGAIAIGGGLFFLWEWKNADGTCKVANLSRREKVMRKMRAIVAAPMNPAAIFAILTLAFGVTIIEFACSIGIPQAFTKILEMNAVGFLGQQGFTFLYLLAYMIDDLAVVALAIWSMEKIHLTAKYSAATNLVGGVLMLILGFLLVFSPDTLRFV